MKRAEALSETLQKDTFFLVLSISKKTISSYYFGGASVPRSLGKNIFPPTSLHPTRAVPHLPAFVLYIGRNYINLCSFEYVANKMPAGWKAGAIITVGFVSVAIPFEGIDTLLLIHPTTPFIITSKFFLTLFYHGF